MTAHPTDARDDRRLRLILGSASPARLAILRAAGIDPEVLVSGVDESGITDHRPEALCAALARLKAEAVAAAVGDRGPAAGDERRFVLGCDSVLAFEGQILGKPASAEDAVKRWCRMRGHSGVLHTGHCLIEVTGAGEHRIAERAAATTVHFAEISDEEIDAYVGTGEPLYVAGAFTIDGLGGFFVDRIEGDAGTVIGLSLPTLRTLFHDLGADATAFWRTRARD